MDNIFHKIGSFISRQDYFLKWFILGLINGVVSGLGALFFYYSLKLCEFIFFNKILHYHIPSPLVRSQTTLFLSQDWFICYPL